MLPDGPAAKAGIQRGDKIMKVNEEEISSASHLINFVALQEPNSTIQIEIQQQKTMILEVVVTERKAQDSASQYIPSARPNKFDQKKSLMMRDFFYTFFSMSSNTKVKY